MPIFATQPVIRKRKTSYELTREQRNNCYWRKIKTFGNYRQKYQQWLQQGSELTWRSLLNLGPQSLKFLTLNDQQLKKDFVQMSEISQFVVFENGISDWRGRYLFAIFPSELMSEFNVFFDWFLRFQWCEHKELGILEVREPVKGVGPFGKHLRKKVKIALLYSRNADAKQWVSFIHRMNKSMKMFFHIWSPTDVDVTKHWIFTYYDKLKNSSSWAKLLRLLLFDYMKTKGDEYLKLVVEINDSFDLIN